VSLQLQLETTNVCQADCVFCSYTQMTRPKGTMPMPLFRKIVDDAVAIPLIENITLTGLGETLLDRHLVERIRYIKALRPHLAVDLYTNGNLLKPATTDALIAAGLDGREIMHLDDFDQVLGYLDYALQAIKGTRTRIIVKGVASKDLMEIGEHDAFLDRWGGDHTKGGAAYLHLEGNWAGAMGQKMRTTPRNACHRAFGQIMVLWDGRVSLCCFDGFGEVILGDLATQTIREVYNGERATGIRVAHHEGRRSELPLCGTCTAI
jgi:hypothetical protein